MLEFRILGTLEVVRDGKAVELPRKRQQAVLTLLLLDANHVVSADVLKDRLWGDEPPPTATASLHNTIHQLRKLLGEDAIETRPPGYLLHVDPEHVDVARFERALREARDATPDARGHLLAGALAEWRGAPLAESAYEPWAETEVRRLEELRTSALEDRIDADLAAGRGSELVAELESLVAQHPLRERLRGQLMLALYRAGRQGDASLAYQDARRALVTELGVEPGPELRRLHGAIIRQDVDDASPSRPMAQGDVSDVVAALLEGRVVSVLGEDGDALAARLVERFRYPRDEPTDIARVSQFVATTNGYGPLHDELHDWMAASEEPGDAHRFLASLPPLLRARGLRAPLVVTTSYGNSLERAFADAGEEIDVVSYVPAGPSRGKFVHRSPDGRLSVIDTPNLYAQELSLDRRTIVLKLRGALGPWSDVQRSVVVTEDDHIEYLRRADVQSAVPVALAAELRRSHFLFLGCTARDWTLRLVLGRIWGDEPIGYRSWAVHPQPGPGERELWRRLDVELTETPVERYVRVLADALSGAPV